MRRLLIASLVACGFLMLEGSRCSAGIVLSWGTFPNEGGNVPDNAPGEQLVLSSTITDITFSWLRRTSNSPFHVDRLAFGNVYILNQIYTGAPSGLAAYVALNPSRFVAESVSNNGGSFYSFNPITLTAGTYFFYTDATAASVGKTYSLTMNDYQPTANGGVNDYTAGQVAYTASTAGSSFTTVSGAHPNNYFELTGTVVPEPATLFPALLGGMMCLGYGWRQGRKASPRVG